MTKKENYKTIAYREVFIMIEKIYTRMEKHISELQRRPFRNQLVRDYIEDVKTTVETSYAEMSGQNCENVDVYKWLRLLALFQYKRKNTLVDSVIESNARVDAGFNSAIITESDFAARKYDEALMSCFWLFLELLFEKEAGDGNDK